MKLTPEQIKAISHRGSHLQIIACAGSGKTEVMARRVSSLIKEGISPASIIAFTFTERAAESLKLRIHQRIAEVMGAAFLDRLSSLFIGTIHAYCLRLLQNHVPHFGNYDILDENRLAGLVSREYKRLELNRLGTKHWDPIFEFLRNAKVMENELIPASAIKGTDFGFCYARYQEMLHRYHFLSFGQIITEAIEALSDRGVFNRVHGPLRHLLVDEYQDINPAQEELIQLLAKRPVHLTVVGDDDQSIYQWRGSEVNNILTFKKRYQSSTALSLSLNRRSRPKIIDSANRFVRSISPRLNKQMRPHRPASTTEVHCWSGETNHDEAHTIAETIEKLAAKGYRYRDIAILCRSVRTSADLLVSALRERGIPFRCGGRTGLFQQPEADVMGRTYAWLVDNEWRKEIYGKSSPVCLKDILTGYEWVFGGGKAMRSIEKHLVDWKAHIDDKTGSVNLVRDYYRLLRLLGVHKMDLDDPDKSARMGCLARFSQILADYEHVTRRSRFVAKDKEGAVYKSGLDHGKWYYYGLFSYVQYYALSAYEDFEGEDSFDLDAVDILTVHQAKGLEWPIVFIPCLTRSRFPAGKAGKPQAWLLPNRVFSEEARSRYSGGITEERRLFYVAMTRARDCLYLSYFTRMKRQFDPSDFLCEVAGGAPQVQSTLPLPDSCKQGVTATEEPPSLSFSELSLYERCPLRYRLSTAIGFQPPLAIELGYGKAIHHLLRRVADFTRQRGKLPTKSQVSALFESEFYLPFANENAFQQLKARAESLVERYLSVYSHDLMRVWETERPFELHLNDGIVHGRADVILDKENGIPDRLAIVDYKTADDVRPNDLFAFQLAIYTAAGRGEGLQVDAAFVHHLGASSRESVPVTVSDINSATGRANKLIVDMKKRKFKPKPGKATCPSCDMHAVCKHSIVN